MQSFTKLELNIFLNNFKSTLSHLEKPLLGINNLSCVEHDEFCKVIETIEDFSEVTQLVIASYCNSLEDIKYVFISKRESNYVIESYKDSGFMPYNCVDLELLLKKSAKYLECCINS